MDTWTQQSPSDPSSVDEQERLLIDAVVTLARSLRDERDRLAERLQRVERELAILVARLDVRDPEAPE